MAFNYKHEYERYKRYYQSIEPVLEKPANRAYTAIIFSFLVISLFSWYAIRPTLQTIFTLQREIADKTEIDKKMEDKISALIEAQAVYQEVEQNIPLLNQALPETTEPVRAAAQLQALANDSRVTIKRLGISTVPLTSAPPPAGQKNPSSQLTDFPISLLITGSYPDVKNFIQGSLNMRRIMNITSMNFALFRQTEPIASGSAIPSGTQIQLDLKLKLFNLSS